MRKKIIFTVVGIVGLIILFCTSFYLTKWYYAEKWASEKSEDTVTVNATKDAINDNMTIIKETNSSKDDEIKVSDFKEEFELSGALNIDDISEVLANEGYEYKTKDASAIYYTRKKEYTNENLEPNKYYLGEHEGKLAILKAGEDGKAFLEAKEDQTNKDVDSLREEDQKNIRSFTEKFDSKEDAKEAITDYTS